MSFRWRKHVYSNGEIMFFADAEASVGPSKSGTVFEKTWAKFFKELGKRGELRGKRGVACCVEITSGDFTFYAFRSDSRNRKGTHVGLTFPYAADFTSRLYEKTDGAPPFDRELEKLTAGYVNALRDKFEKARPVNSELLLCVIDPEGEAV